MTDPPMHLEAKIQIAEAAPFDAVLAQQVQSPVHTAQRPQHPRSFPGPDRGSWRIATIVQNAPRDCLC